MDTFNTTLSIAGTENQSEPVICQVFIISDQGCFYKIYFFVNILLTVAGVLVNSTTLYVFYSSKKLRKISSYVYLYHITGIDLMVCVCNGMCYISVITIQLNLLESNDSYCKLIGSYLLVYLFINLSTYTLLLYSLDILISVIWPIPHRILFTNDNRRYSLVALWILTMCISFGFGIISNGYNENIGVCFYWNKFNGKAHMIIHITSINIITFTIPLVSIVSCYFFIYYYITLNNSKAISNTLRLALRVTVAYVVCVGPQAITYTLDMFGYSLCQDSPELQLILLLVIINSVVNPLIYTLQFKLFRYELSSTILKCCRQRVDPLNY